MSAARYWVARLAPDFDLESFDCGAPAYNTWLRQHAASSVQAGICAVYLLIETHNDRTRVVGYYAINPTLVVRESVPRTIARGWPDSVPAWKLGKLAVHLDLRADSQSEWERQLLRNALETIVGVAQAGGGKVIVADADNEELMSFYMRNGFTPTGVDGDLSLYLKISTARRWLLG